MAEEALRTRAVRVRPSGSCTSTWGRLGCPEGAALRPGVWDPLHPRMVVDGRKKRGWIDPAMAWKLRGQGTRATESGFVPVGADVELAL